MATVPFSSSRKRMSCIAKINNKTFIYSKGAPDFLLPSCTRFIGKSYI